MSVTKQVNEDIKELQELRSEWVKLNVEIEEFDKTFEEKKLQTTTGRKYKKNIKAKKEKHIKQEKIIKKIEKLEETLMQLALNRIDYWTEVYNKAKGHEY